MALAAGDFQRPTGRLNSAWFEDDLTGILTTLMTQAALVTDVEAAQKAWVYARAYQLLADDRALIAATVAGDDIRESYSDSQVTHWQRLANAAQGQFEALMGGQRLSGVTSVTPAW